MYFWCCNNTHTAATCFVIEVLFTVSQLWYLILLEKLKVIAKTRLASAVDRVRKNVHVRWILYFVCRKIRRNYSCKYTPPIKTLTFVGTFTGTETQSHFNTQTLSNERKPKQLNIHLVTSYQTLVREFIHSGPSCLWLVCCGSHQINTWTWTSSRSQKKENTVSCSFSLNFPQVEICSQNNLKCCYS